MPGVSSQSTALGHTTKTPCTIESVVASSEAVPLVRSLTVGAFGVCGAQCPGTLYLQEPRYTRRALNEY